MNSKYKLALYLVCISSLIYGLFAWDYISMGVGVASLVIARPEE